MTKQAEGKTISNQSGTSHGYIVEWRIKDKDIKIVSEKLLNSMPGPEWRQAPYDIKKMVMDQKTNEELVRPIISHYAELTLVPYGLINKDAAEALLTCLRSMLASSNPILAGLVILRLRQCEVTYSWDVVAMGEEEDDVEDSE